MTDTRPSAPDLVGPLETAKFPNQLRARVITPGLQAKVHGYDVETDLARHYGFVDLVLVTLTGELPPDPIRSAVSVAFVFLAPVSVAHASVHATVLSRLCGAPTSSTAAVAALGLAEQAHLELAQHTELLVWLRDGGQALPNQYRASQSDRESVCRLTDALPPDFELAILQHDPSRAAALVAVLYAAGLCRIEQLEAAFVLARMPSAMAEAFAERPANFGRYPVNLPPFLYRDP